MGNHHILNKVYLHHSRNGPLDLEKLVLKSQHDCLFKPSGIWISPVIEGTDKGEIDLTSEWAQWSRDSGCGYTHNTHRITLVPNAKICCLSTLDDLVNFKKLYQHCEGKLLPYQGFISWEKVSHDYDGFLVDNYYLIKAELNQRDHSISEYVWFYALDVNGGCIWNPKVIKTLEFVNNDLNE